MSYDLLSRLFPRSFALKIFFVAFLGTHVPLIALIFFVVLRGGAGTEEVVILALVLAATLIGTAATLMALKRLLGPLRNTIEAFHLFESTGIRSSLPESHRDELGYLMSATNRLTGRVADQIESLETAAETDPLTGALNRRGFARRLERVPTGCLVHFDVDDFKNINDVHGHGVGDAVLSGLAEQVRNWLPKEAIFARIGGEEFAILLQDDCRACIGCVQAFVEKVAETPLSGVQVTISAGMAEFRGRLAEALAEADLGTYAAKRAGKNRLGLRHGSQR